MAIPDPGPGQLLSCAWAVSNSFTGDPGHNLVSLETFAQSVTGTSLGLKCQHCALTSQRPEQEESEPAPGHQSQLLTTHQEQEMNEASLCHTAVVPATHIPLPPSLMGEGLWAFFWLLSGLLGLGVGAH